MKLPRMVTVRGIQVDKEHPEPPEIGIRQQGRIVVAGSSGKRTDRCVNRVVEQVEKRLGMGL